MRKIISLLLICVLLMTMAVGCSEEDTNPVALTIGENQLSTADLSYFYMDKVIEYRQSIYSQYSYLGDYWSAMMGFDPEKPLNEQKYNDEQTWADYFMDIAINTARDAYALYDEAKKANFSMSEAEKDSVEEMIVSLTAYAIYYGYSDLNAYLQMWYGPNADEASYRKYYEVCTTAYSYMEQYSLSIELSEEELRTYENEHYDDFSVVSFDYFSLQYKSYLGEGTKDDKGNTTWTDEEIQAAREALLADVQTLQNGNITTLEEFDSALQALEVNKTDDDKNKVTAMVIQKASIGGLSLTPDAKDWLRDTERQVGDFGAFPKYTYAEHADANHEHGDSCGCERSLDSVALLLFTQRDDQRTNLVNIRHILVRFTGGTTDDSGNVTYSDADQLKAKSDAEKLLQQWKDGEATEESFAALANAESDDQGGKVTNGGLYENVYPGQMVKHFDAWCFDPNRQARDTGIVISEYGYHVMYFSSVDETTYRDMLVDQTLRTQRTEAWYNAIIAATTCEKGDLSAMAYDLKLGA